MATTEVLKDLAKPPFANYDIVVYFGCGLFAIPFIRHYYILPLGLSFPEFRFGIGIQFTDALISTLCLLFSVYVVGHIIAYTGSQIIERTMDTFFGKTSTVVLISSMTEPETRNEAIRAHVFNRAKKAFSRHSWLASSARTLTHLPMMPLYAVVFISGIFGYYHSRIPQSIMDAARIKMGDIGIHGARISLNAPWFKVVEHYVTNNFPVASARMYNYLVISGIFRSISTILLFSIWMEVFYLICMIRYGSAPSGIVSDSMSLQARVASYALLSTVFIFSLFSYLKFQRRYVEEAIFAFVLAKDGD